MSTKFCTIPLVQYIHPILKLVTSRIRKPHGLGLGSCECVQSSQMRVDPGCQYMNSGERQERVAVGELFRRSQDSEVGPLGSG